MRDQTLPKRQGLAICEQPYAYWRKYFFVASLPPKANFFKNKRKKPY